MAGQVITYLKLNEDKIINIRFKGDFIGSRDVAELEDLLQGTAYNKVQIIHKLNTTDILRNFSNSNINEFLSLIIK